MAVARRALILRVAAGALAFTLLVLVVLPARYTASAVVMLEPRRNNVTNASAVLSQMPTDPASLQNQIQILTSRELAGKVIDKLGLASDPAFEPWAGWFRRSDPKRLRDRAIDAFLKRLSVETIGLSTSLEIGFAARDAEKSARIANAVADAYVGDQVNAKFEATARTTQWLIDRIKRLAVQVQASEEAMQRYKTEHNLNDTAEGHSLVDQQMSAISTQLVAARADLAQKQATYARVTHLVKSGRAADVSQAVASPLIMQLRAQETDLIQRQAELATRYGPKHPKMIEIESQKKNLDAKIAQEVHRVVETAANDVAVAGAQVSSLEASLDGIEHSAATEDMARVKLKSLEANAASTQNMYQAFVSRLRATQDSTADQMADARVISRAPVPDAPDGPRKLFMILAAIPASLLLGLLAALIAERLEAGRVSLPGAPVMARIPVSQTRLSDDVIDWPQSPQARAVSELADALLPHGAGGRAVMIAPAAPGDSQTDLTVALARSAARNGRRVIVIDGNFRNPRVAHAVGVTGQSGLVAALTGRLRLSQCVYRDTRSPAFMLGCSQGLHNPSQLLASPAMAQLVAHLRGACDLVLIESGPVLASSDAAQLARLCDTAILVVHNTSRDATAAAFRELAGTAPRTVLVAMQPRGAA
jgi:uncharacterized protein involved in exopolysaccharide biosynthesis